MNWTEHTKNYAFYAFQHHTTLKYIKFKFSIQVTSLFSLPTRWGSWFAVEAYSEETLMEKFVPKWVLREKNLRNGSFYSFSLCFETQKTVLEGHPQLHSDWSFGLTKNLGTGGAL